MSLSSYYKKYDAQNMAELERQKEALREMSETQKNIVNENADASIKQIQEAGNAEIRTAEHAYDGVINTANVQKLINERQIAERMANLGMTDSGLNRTQQTAVQLSHSNAVGDAQLARQKQIDALALAISQKVGTVNMQRNTDLTNLDLSYQQNIYNADEQYRANRDSWASAQYKADQEAATARARLQAEAEAQQREDRNNLIEMLESDKYSKTAKDAFVQDYFDQYGYDELVLGYYGNSTTLNAKADKNAKEQNAKKETAREKLITQLNNTDDNQEKMSLAQSYYNTYGNDADIHNLLVSQGVFEDFDRDNAVTWDFSNDKKSTTAIPAYKQEKGENAYTFAQRTADDSFLNSEKGTKIVKALGTPNENLPQYAKQSIAQQIMDWYDVGYLGEGEVVTLLRTYSIPENIFGASFDRETVKK